jgi:hypothetical protein
MRLAPQLARILSELADARRRAHDVSTPLTAERWSARTAANEWSVAECVIHLNLTSRAFVPLIREALGRGRDQRLFAAGPYRRDLTGWFVSWMTEPPIRLPIRTTEPFVPARVEPRDVVLAAFDELREALTACVRDANGLDLGRLRIVSPFAARLKYNLYSCLRIIPAHQRLHLSQAEQVIRSLRRGSPGR